jgi:hypothetical protein
VTSAFIGSGVAAMGAALRIVDETSSGKFLREGELRLVSERVTARQVVELRVRGEVARFNEDDGADIFRGLVQPTDTEQQLNGFKLKKRRRLDAEAQVASAFRAFESNGFLMLIGDHQIESLDEKIVVTPGTQVSFIKLVPLVGG